MGRSGENRWSVTIDYTKSKEARRGGEREKLKLNADVYQRNRRVTRRRREDR